MTQLFSAQTGEMSIEEEDIVERGGEECCGGTEKGTELEDIGPPIDIVKIVGVLDSGVGPVVDHVNGNDSLDNSEGYDGDAEGGEVNGDFRSRHFTIISDLCVQSGIFFFKCFYQCVLYGRRSPNMLVH